MRGTCEMQARRVGPRKRWQRQFINRVDQAEPSSYSLMARTIICLVRQSDVFNHISRHADKNARVFVCAINTGFVSAMAPARHCRTVMPLTANEFMGFIWMFQKRWKACDQKLERLVLCSVFTLVQVKLYTVLAQSPLPCIFEKTWDIQLNFYFFMVFGF